MTDNIEKHVLEAARDAYAAQGDLRRRRMRYKRFTYGDQWGDIVRDSRGALVREGDLMAAGGRPPLTNNLIRRLVKTIVGRWRTMAVESRRYDAPALYARLNSLAELDARMLEEFLISGCAIQRVSRENRVPAGSAVWVDNVSPRDFFVNAFSDPRGHDIRLVGMLHEMTPVELAARFGRKDRLRMAALLQRASRWCATPPAKTLRGHAADTAVSLRFGPWIAPLHPPVSIFPWDGIADGCCPMAHCWTNITAPSGTACTLLLSNSIL